MHLKLSGIEGLDTVQYATVTYLLKKLKRSRKHVPFLMNDRIGEDRVVQGGQEGMKAIAT